MEELYTWSKNGMKMIIDSGYKTFDKQTNYITSGNVISNTQFGNYIRPYFETTNPVGQKVKEGYLREYDLKYFKRNEMSNTFKDWLYNVTRIKKMILYEFFIYRNDNREVVGWLVEDSNTGKVIGQEINYYSNIRNSNCNKVLNFCKKLIETKRRER